MRWQSEETLPILNSTFQDFLKKSSQNNSRNQDSCGQSSILHMRGDVYIHRCPFNHCTHKDGCGQMLHIKSMHFGTSFDVGNDYSQAQVDDHTPIQGHEFKDMIQYRQRVIAYM